MSLKASSQVNLVKERALHFSELVKDRYYFATVTDANLKHFLTSSDSGVSFLYVDNELTYQSFNRDFGPLNIAMLYQYCVKVNLSFQNKNTIVHLTGSNKEKRANSAFLVGSYCIIYCQIPPSSVVYLLKEMSISYLTYKSFAPFVHAGFDSCNYLLYIEDCFDAVHKAYKRKLLDFNQFSLDEYLYYEKVENGDFNWIVPNKLIAFCDPQTYTKSNLNYFELYLKYFSKHNVTTVIRLNQSQYDPAIFTSKGIKHYDLIFTDGGTPTDFILKQFLQICQTAPGNVAVHCKAGLGRTGTLIAAYIMKHYRFTALQAIAWVRICRPGSIVGYQQKWLEKKQNFLWSDEANIDVEPVLHKNHLNDDSFTLTVVKCHIVNKPDEISKSVTSLTNTKDSTAKWAIKLKSENAALTQGDLLNRIKLFRKQSSMKNNRRNQLSYSLRYNKHDVSKSSFKNSTTPTTTTTTTTTGYCESNKKEVCEESDSTVDGNFPFDDSLQLFGKKMTKYPSVTSKVLPH